MKELKIIPVTLEKYNELVYNGEIDETALYTIVDNEELKQDDYTIIVPARDA